MEPAGAVDLVVNSKILKQADVQVGIFIADNDSTSVSAIQNTSDHLIVKQSDMIHSKKGVGNHLHDIHKNKALDPDQELTLDAINHIKICFSAAVHQNKGNVTKFKNALDNIPYHLFDMHANCGDWCKNESNKENSIRIRFSNPNLFDALEKFFSQLDARKFCSAASSQANESLNNCGIDVDEDPWIY